MENDAIYGVFIRLLIIMLIHEERTNIVFEITDKELYATSPWMHMVN